MNSLKRKWILQILSWKVKMTLSMGTMFTLTREKICPKTKVMMGMRGAVAIQQLSIVGVG